MTYVRPGGCQHPKISDKDLDEREALIFKQWGGDALTCPDCNEYLYPHDETVYVGEPYGAGADPYDRPLDRKFWTE